MTTPKIGAACLSGTYTIGGTSPDYLSFSDAIADLKTSGICGKVVFKVRDGSYNEYIVSALFAEPQ